MSWKKFKHKLFCLKEIIFSKHGIVITISEDDFMAMVRKIHSGSSDENFGAYIIYYGLQEYPAVWALKKLADSWDEDDMILSKADLDAQVHEHLNK